MWLFLRNRGVLDSTFSPGLGVLLKICLFGWDIEVFWILIKRKNSEGPFKIRYSGKVMLFFFYPEKTDRQIFIDLVNRGVLLNNWIPWEMHIATPNLFLTAEHLNSCDKRNKIESKKFDNDFMSANCDVIVIFRLMANLEQSRSWIPDA